MFGLTATATESAEPSEAAAAVHRHQEAAYILWADLRSGFIGFPSGLDVPHGPPGSIMKLVAAAAILENGLLDPNRKFDCLGHASIDKQQFSCRFPHGHVDLTMAIANSCNCYFVHASHHITTAVILEYARKFGLNAPVARHSSGPFPQTSRAPSYQFVLGLSEAVQPTALQLLRLAALVAANGKPPYLHSADDTETCQPFHLALSESTWRRLHQGMELAVRDGTARKLDPENQMHIAAKTGTSMHGKKFQSCIIGFFPAQAPKNVFCLWAATGTSQESAVPQAKEFLFSTTWP